MINLNRDIKGMLSVQGLFFAFFEFDSTDSRYELFDNTKPFDLVDNPSNPANEYDGKALDFGHNCPPHCNAVEYQRNDLP